TIADALRRNNVGVATTNGVMITPTMADPRNVNAAIRGARRHRTTPAMTAAVMSKPRIPARSTWWIVLENLLVCNKLSKRCATDARYFEEIIATRLSIAVISAALIATTIPMNRSGVLATDLMFLLSF